MNIQSTWKSKRTPSEVITALTDFARLSQQASALLSSPQDPPDALSLRLLMRLLSFCHANQGAFALSFQTSDTGKPSPDAPARGHGQMFPLLLRYQMDEEMVTTAFARFSSDGPDMQELSSMPYTLVWRRMIETQVEEGPQSSGRPLASLAPRAYAYFLFHWSATEHQAEEQMHLDVQELLSFVTEAVDAVIVPMLQALRVRDLEHLAQQHIEHNNELLKAELLATVSHELRGPLASIQGYTTTLLCHDQRIAPEERHEFLVAINSACIHLETIVNRLLDVAQLETKTVPFEPTPVNVIHLVQEALTAARCFERDKVVPQEGIDPPQVRYTLHSVQEYDASLNDGLSIQGDRRLLRNLLDHLLENATHYSPPGGNIEVGVRAFRHQEALLALEEQLQQVKPTMVVLPSANHRGVPQVEIWMKDRGSGIALEHLPHIFERFYRADMSLIREVNGLGLGLTICKSIVALHGGTIWVESEVGKGSTFHVLLPQSEHRPPGSEETV